MVDKVASLTFHPFLNLHSKIPSITVPSKTMKKSFQEMLVLSASDIAAEPAAVLPGGWLEARLQKPSSGRPWKIFAHCKARPAGLICLSAFTNTDTIPHLHLDNNQVHSSDARTLPLLSGFQPICSPVSVESGCYYILALLHVLGEGDEQLKTTLGEALPKGGTHT